MEDRRAPDTALDALAHRLLWYGTAAGVALTAPAAADAQVASARFDPLVVLRDESYEVDFDGDGDPEIHFFEQVQDLRTATVANSDIPGDAMTKLIGVFTCIIDTNCSLTYPYGYAHFWLPLDAGVTVSAGAPSLLSVRTFPWSKQNFTDGIGSDPNGWEGAGLAYIGFEVTIDDLPHYGWARVRVPAGGGELHLHSTAYNATPGAPITTGDTGTAAPAVTLDGTVNQTTFPAEGGTLAFTATVTNTTPEPEPRALWMVARRAGEVVSVVRFGSGTLAPGATVTRTVEVRVPARLPAGTYDVRFHLGRYPAVLDSAPFTLVKAGAVGVPAGEGALFQAEPIPGDLFAEATAAAIAPAAVRGLASAHALGAPSPNPATGRVSISLTVGEAQPVRVTVHDALGREVALLHDGPMAGGIEHRLGFDRSGLAPGVYAVRAVGAAFAGARTVVLTR